jgi:hypothetical protein
VIDDMIGVTVSAVENSPAQSASRREKTHNQCILIDASGEWALVGRAISLKLATFLLSQRMDRQSNS